MTEKKVSEIEAYSKPDKSKSGRWGITFGETDEEGKDIWYNSFEGFPDFIDKGVVVKVEYEENEKYNSRDIKSISPYDEKEKKKGTQSRKDTNESITKAVAWKVAMNCEKVGGFNEKKKYARKVYKDLKKDWDR